MTIKTETMEKIKVIKIDQKSRNPEIDHKSRN